MSAEEKVVSGFSRTCSVRRSTRVRDPDGLTRTRRLREHGGLPGIRDGNALESALTRPQQRWHYAERANIATLAAAFCFGLVRNHPYRDGNKRIGFLAMLTFLGMNGRDFHATDAEVVTDILALADGRVSEDELAGWIREHTAKS